MNIYRRKRGFNAVLVLICAAMCAAIMFSSCPTSGTDPNPPPVNPPVEPPSNPEFDVWIADPPPPISQGECTVLPEKAHIGDTITITMRPNTGFTPKKPVAYTPDNRTIPVTSGEVTAESNTYTFVMPTTLVYPSIVRVSLSFDTDPVEPPVEPSIPEFEVWIANPPTDQGECIVDKVKAKIGDTITITMKPNTGFAPKKPVAYISPDNRSIPVTPGEVTAESYTYTFEMPTTLVSSSFVRVILSFDTVINTLDTATALISRDSSWEEIFEFNELIKKAQRLNSTVSADVTKLQAAVTKLAGTRYVNPPANPPDPGVDDIWDKLGVIIAKMRVEDLTTWIPLKYPSYRIDKGADMINQYYGPTVTPSPTPTRGYPYGVDRTHIYYVKEDNPTLATLVPEKGWKAGYPSLTSYAPQDLDGIQEILLKYEVGTQPATEVTYSVWLWPCAQYTVRYEPSVTSSVTIQDHYPIRLGNSPNTPTPGYTDKPSILVSGTPSAQSNFYYEVDGAQTLNSTSSTQRTGQVGIIRRSINPNNTYTELEREVFVKIQPTQPNVLVGVYDSSGQYVANVLEQSNPNQQGSAYDQIRAISGSPLLDNVASNKPGAFYPESKNYTIWVRPQSIPGPLNP